MTATGHASPAGNTYVHVRQYAYGVAAVHMHDPGTYIPISEQELSEHQQRYEALHCSTRAARVNIQFDGPAQLPRPRQIMGLLFGWLVHLWQVGVPAQRVPSHTWPP